MLYDFSDRRGLKQEFGAVDDEVRVTIVDDMVKIIEAGMQGDVPFFSDYDKAREWSKDNGGY